MGELTMLGVRKAARLWVAAAVALSLAAGPVAAQITIPETPPEEAPETEATAPSFVLELNRLEPAENACRVTFVATNGLGAPLDKIALEFVLFDAQGLVDRITVFDFGAVPDGKTIARQFVLSDMDCANVGRILINAVSACEGAGFEAGACLNALAPGSKTEIQFGL